MTPAATTYKTITRREAKLIAEELYGLIRGDIARSVAAITQDEADTWVGVDEAAAMLGCSTKTVYNKIVDLPHRKVGNKLRFSRTELTKYINSKKTY